MATPNTRGAGGNPRMTNSERCCARNRGTQRRTAELAPKFTQLADADASYLWSVKLDSKGVPYTAGGSPAKVFKLDANGKAATVFESSELSAQANCF